MKKMIKSRIFLVIICGIVFTSIGVYAVTKYNATDIVYNASDGTSMTVNDALNELYNNMSTSSGLVKASNNAIPAGVTKAYVFVLHLTSYNFQITSITGSIIISYKIGGSCGPIYLSGLAAGGLEIYELQLSGDEGTINVTFTAPGDTSKYASSYSIYYLN